MRLVAIEGNTQKLDGGAMYGNAPRAMWASWSPPDDQNRIALSCRALLLETADGRRVLFEAGIGAFFEPRLRERYGVVESEHVLVKNLTAAGAPPDSIDAVVLSHLHFDHAGGLLSAYGDGEPRLIFSKARFYVGRAHWDRSQNPHARDRASFIPGLGDLLRSSGRLTLVESDGVTDLAPQISFRFSDGHTPGLMLAQIALAGGPIVFAADLVPGIPWVHVPITMGYDRFPELLIEEKGALLKELASSSGKLFFTHDPAHACGRVVCDAKGKYSAVPVDLSALAGG